MKILKFTSLIILSFSLIQNFLSFPVYSQSNNCDIGQIYVDGECKDCSPLSITVRNTCIHCDPNEVPSEHRTRCDPCPPRTFAMRNGRCTCEAGYRPVLGRCVEILDEVSNPKTKRCKSKLFYTSCSTKKRIKPKTNPSSSKKSPKQIKKVNSLFTDFKL
jgi:hypothetical protein